jgi:hypothetical protein
VGMKFGRTVRGVSSADRYYQSAVSLTPSLHYS